MGHQVTPQTIVAQNFPASLHFDVVHCFAENAAVTLCGAQTVCLCLQTSNMPYEVIIAKNEHVVVYTCFAENAEASMHIVCEDGATCEHYVMQTTSATYNVAVEQQENSTYKGGYFQLAGTRNDIVLQVKKNKPQANTDLFGVFFPKAEEQYSIHTRVEHNSHDCETEELFRGIADEQGSGSFSGLIYVARDAQKSIAQQKNRNILLSSSAHIHSEPQLEIYADDVVCNHGSSTGQIDAEALWYMEARGIDKKTGMKLFVSGFANDVLEKVEDKDFRMHISNIILQKTKL